jgi:glucosamine-phosphate N-acetyltransferase
MGAVSSSAGADAIVVRDLQESDFDTGFLEALEALTDVGLNAAKARVLYEEWPPDQHVYVAVCQTRVVGTASLLVERKFIHAGGRVGHLEDVAISRTGQFRGVGTALVRHAVEQARGFGCYKVILDCAEPVVGFYERLGFRPHNRGLRLDLKEK